MNWKETYTKVFLKAAGIGISDSTLAEYVCVCGGKKILDPKKQADLDLPMMV